MTTVVVDDFKASIIQRRLIDIFIVNQAMKVEELTTLPNTIVHTVPSQDYCGLIFYAFLEGLWTAFIDIRLRPSIATPLAASPKGDVIHKTGNI